MSNNMDPYIEKDILDKLVTNSLIFTMTWIYGQLHNNTMDFEKFENYLRNSDTVKYDYPYLINALDYIKKEGKNNNNLGQCLQAFFSYINANKKSRTDKFLSQLGDEEQPPSEEMEELFKQIHYHHQDRLYCIDFQMNASFMIHLTKKNKFIEINNGDRISCIVISANKKEAYELFKMNEKTPIKFFDNNNVTVYGVRFQVSSDVEDIYSLLITPNSRLVKNSYLES